MPRKRFPNQYRIEGDVVFITLHDQQGQAKAEAKISLVDLEQTLNNGSWSIARLPKRSQGDGYLYVRNTDGVLLHRLILNATPEQIIDHINHDPLDNRRGNLRFVTKSQNAQNMIGPNCNSRSGVKNVFWNRRRQRWSVQISLDGRRYSFGNHESLESAEEAAINARKLLHTHCPENLAKV